MSNFEFTSNSIQDTINLGKYLASKLDRKDIIVLSGDLGSGKTKFTEGFLTFFRITKRNIKSYIYNSK